MRSPRQPTWLRPAGVTSLVVLATLFSLFNAGERVTIHFGVTVLYRVSLVGALFAAVLLGMFVMFLLGLRQDRRVRARLRELEHANRLRDAPVRSPPDNRM